ncbi:MAG: hypothetical protein BMS9Abin05_0581 [Rhodothermia bacterium]|nr:MAG: hypothetical protein BMS9Abin05_0581 [Rhodothermia bacterium]
MKYAPLVGRILFSLIFLMFGMAHFTDPQIKDMVPDFLPFPTLVVMLTGAAVIAGGLSVLLGYKIKIGSLILFVFLLSTTLLVWSGGFFEGDQAATGFIMRDLAMAGASLFIYHFGAGPYSFDAKAEAAA